MVDKFKSIKKNNKKVTSANVKLVNCIQKHIVK